MDSRAPPLSLVEGAEREGAERSLKERGVLSVHALTAEGRAGVEEGEMDRRIQAFEGRSA